MSDLLEDLREEGRVDSTGRFTLDAARAREKMKKYQLTDPHLYVLQVVQAAVAGGASGVDVRCDADDCWLRYDGRLLSEADLRNLFSSLFAPDAPPALRELAIGLNAAQSLNPSWILVESWDGAGGRALRLEGTREEVAPLAACPWPEDRPGNRVHVRQRVSWKVVARFLQGLVAPNPEAQALTERCRWSPIPVLLEGRDVRPQQGDLGPALARASVDRTGLRADLVVPPGLLDKSEIDVVLHGVTVCRKTVDLDACEVRGVVWSSRLHKNVSQSDVVDDAEWRSLRNTLRAESRRLVIEMARDPRAGTEPHLLRAILRQRIRAGKGYERWKDLKQALIDVPLFHRYDGEKVALRSLLEEYVRRGFLPVSSAEHRSLRRVDLLAVWPTPDTDEVLREVFPTRRNVDAELAAARRVQDLEDQWRATEPRPPALMGSYLARVPLDPPLEGEAALPDGPPRPDPTLLLFKERRPLMTVPFQAPGTAEKAALWPGVAAAANHDGLEPDVAWLAPMENVALEAVRYGVEAALPRLFAALAQVPLAGERRRHAAMAAYSYLQYRAAAGDTGDLPEGLADMPLFRCLDGTQATLRELDAEVRERSEIAWIEERVVVPEGLDFGRRVLRPGPWELRALEDWFGPVRMANVSERMVEESRRARFLEKPPHPVPRAALVSLDLETRDGLKGRIFVPDEGVPGLLLQVLHEGRLLGERFVDSGAGPVVAVVEAPKVRPDQQWTDLVENQEYLRVLEVARGAARRLPAALAAKLDGETREKALDVLWRLLAHEAGPRCDGFFEGLDALRKEMMKLPAFPTVDGRLISLRDVLDEAHRQGKARYLTEPPEAPPEAGETVLLVPLHRTALLRAIVGSYRVADASAEFAARARQRDLQATPPVENLALTAGPHLATAALEGAIEGPLGLLPDPSAPSRLVLHARRRFLGVLEERLPVPVEACLNCDALQAGPDGVARDDALRKLLDHVKWAAAPLAARLVREAEAEELEGDGFRRWALGLASRLLREAAGRKPDDLDRALLAAPLFHGVGGSRLTLQDLSEVFAACGHLGYLPAGGDFPEAEARAAGGGHPVPLLTPLDRERLARVVYPLKDLSSKVEAAIRRRENQARERLADLRLEALFPKLRWLARVAVEEEGLRGEVGLAAEKPAAPCLVLCVEGLPLAREDLHPGPGFLGVVDGPFPPTESWDGLADLREARRLLEGPHRRLMGELIRVFPAPGAPAFGRARQAVLGWTDWRSALQAPLAGVDRALAGLPLFPLAGGRHADLLTVGETVRLFGRLLRSQPGQSPPAGEEPIFEVEAGEATERFLAALSPRGLVEWEVVLVVEVPEEKPAPEPVAPAEPVALPEPSSPPPPTPEEALLAALRGELRLLRETGHPELAEEVLEEIRLGKTPKGTLWSCDKGGRRPVLNADHAAVRRLLREGLRPEGLYFVLSSLYSVLNRACPEIEDRHEREFHRRVLSTLLGTPPPEA